RTDQFSFCVALWEALVGRRPFAGTSSAEIFAAVLVGEIDPPPRGLLPPFLESALRTGLAQRADRRHASMEALLLALANDPRRRRRRRLGLALALAIVPFGFVGLRAYAAVQSRRCDERAASVDAVWNADADASVVAGLGATGAVNASSTATRTSAELSAYADRLREATRAACRAIEIDRVLDDTMAERSVSCLSAREHGLTALVDALSRADGHTVDNATRSVLLLPPPERCTDARALALDLPPPAEPERRAELRRIESELSASESLRRLGRDHDALAKLEALEPAVAELGWPAADAKLANRLAHMHVNVGASERALELSQRAFYSAFRAGDDETMAMSATMVSHVLAILLAREPEAKHWDDLAVAALARLAPEQRPMPELFHSSTQARRRMLAGDDAGAEEAIGRALAEVESFYGPDHLLLSEPLLTLANIQCKRSAWHECRVTHQRAYDIVATKLGDDHPWTARALAGLGVSLGHDGEPERGLALLADALAIDERIFGPDDFNCGVDHSYAGLVLLASHQPERAIPELARALEIGEQTFPPTHPEVVLELINLGRAQREAGRFADARATLERARDRQRENPDTSADARAELDGELAKLAEAER
ncbi:MAG TPA: tetratricopeptide repeat-containing protein kinase family protein, partial [Nannocystaceae bacterium]|nr:tetratricopeptide repeat-containing protein kinase family protein [Nannocystaceae bacterium]